MKESKKVKWIHEKVVPWGLPIVLLVAWQGAVEAGWLSSRVLPAPTDVVAAAWDLLEKGELWQHLSISFGRALIGFAIGGSLGFVLGLLNGVFRPAERLLDTSIQMIRNIPHLAMIPLVILWFGIGEEAKVFLVAIGVLFPIYVNTLHGIRNVDAGLLEMGRVYGLRPWQLFWRIWLPGALSSILVGLRYALGIMWLTLIVAETIAADRGIGYLAMNAREFMQTDVVVFSILLYALFGKLADSIARFLEKRWLRWNVNYQNR
ncbi:MULTISPECIES: aliphatic sulfonate ABC transporter permease SsuC [Geobacillus]|jgi:sulfonate transport system permease protein|uniref:Aliphatic sulfonate ABC transporter permease SsuC n=3 Tax=Geobacillus thermodenitrificans TaxID=33940 RepID=A0ABY9QBU0_GEOTD|nr:MULTISPECIES: aliphatic sulfonate ABC transporter permease SsuC [Geobacillus]MED5074191.1 aliphatic sulfonate ABC transporter permease SsuC [Anoxybacillus geothermalis]ABO67955.1 Putative transport system permease protein of aliphatic sulfonates ABC transporter [Geobacillus thermodenitrificans NG80-2]ARA98879.1 alkanesulfonate transporter permease subunit [Geobacillus thermodenitrificans]ARP43704.1 Putative aliphatic sulfonates transport permease protein SsuC [Geobacillus thermodenitrificans